MNGFLKKPKTYFEDIKEGLNNMHIDPNYPFMIVYIHITQTFPEKVPLTSFGNLKILSWSLFVRSSKEEYRISFRSKQYINVAKIAHAFDGGGHVRASGRPAKPRFLHSMKNSFDYVAGISMNGFLLVNKPKNHIIRCHSKIKHFFPKNQIGHSGTLDPFATGLLIVAIGRDYTRQLNTPKSR